MNAAAALLLLLAAQEPSEATGPALTLDGPTVVFVAPEGAAGEAVRQQLGRVEETLKKKGIRAVATPPTLVRLGEDGGSPQARVRKVDFRKTPEWAGTVIFTFNFDPRLHQGVDGDDQLLKRIDTYMSTAKKAQEKAKKSR